MRIRHQSYLRCHNRIYVLLKADVLIAERSQHNPQSLIAAEVLQTFFGEESTFVVQRWRGYRIFWVHHDPFVSVAVLVSNFRVSKSLLEKKGLGMLSASSYIIHFLYWNTIRVPLTVSVRKSWRYDGRLHGAVWIRRSETVFLIISFWQFKSIALYCR